MCRFLSVCDLNLCTTEVEALFTRQQMLGETQSILLGFFTKIDGSFHFLFLTRVCCVPSRECVVEGGVKVYGGGW